MAIISVKSIIFTFIINILFLWIKINGDGSVVPEADAGPAVIKINIRIGDNEEEEIEVSKLEENYIANENLKVWTIHTASDEDPCNINPINENNKQVGEWIMYQNRTLQSAVVYFKKLKLLGGIVGTKEYIVDFVNYEGTDNITVIDPSYEVLIRTKRKIEEIFQGIADSFPETTRVKRTADNSTPEIDFYLESLIIISGKLNTKYFSTKGSLSNEDYIKYVLVFFNVVDVKLPTTFKINIAGILLRRHPDELPFFRNEPFINVATNQLEVIAARESLEKFAKDCNPKISSDIYDYVIHLTEHSLYHNLTDNSTKIDAFLSYPTEGIIASRTAYSGNSHPIIITPSNLNNLSVCYATHQIYHLIAGWNYVKALRNNSTFTVITDDIHNHTRTFRWNEDWCAFINKPHSLGSIPRELVTMDQNCWCNHLKWRYQETTNETNSEMCNKGFQCHNSNNQNIMNVTRVINGTPCGKEKVCWNEQCVRGV